LAKFETDIFQNFFLIGVTFK